MTYFFSEEVFETAPDESPRAHVSRLLLAPHERYQQNVQGVQKQVQQIAQIIRTT